MNRSPMPLRIRVLLALPLFLFAASPAPAEKKLEPEPARAPAPALEGEAVRASYALGANFGLDLKRKGVQPDGEAIVRGLKDALSGGTLLMNDQEREDAIDPFVKGSRRKAEEAFFAQNAKNEGVKVTSSGLHYKVLKAGDAQGPKPKASDTVSTHYRGTFPDGREFDSSYKRGAPATFPVNGVIPGWTEALQLMTAGSKWQLWIPSRLAYGERGRPPVISPDQMLFFEVELVSIH
jgi:FKBP-type peptidyl-prolyl cis-trans isomerase FklB